MQALTISAKTTMTPAKMKRRRNHTAAKAKGAATPITITSVIESEMERRIEKDVVMKSAKRFSR